MFLRKLSWAQLTKGGVPLLFVLRPLSGGFTPPNTGDPYPVPDPADRFQMTRARQLYEQRRIGTRQELDVVLAKAAAIAPAAPEKHAKSRKEKANGKG